MAERIDGLSDSDRMALDEHRTRMRCEHFSVEDARKLRPLIERSEQLVAVATSRERWLWVLGTLRTWGVWVAAVAALLKFGPALLQLLVKGAGP